MKRGRSAGASMAASRAGQSKLSRGKEKEERICDAITKLFEKRHQTMMKAIVDTMYEEKKMYKSFRKEYEVQINELEREKVKLLKRTKKKKKNKAIVGNLMQRMKLMSLIVFKTQNFFREKYFENDHYRMVKLLDLQTGRASTIGTNSFGKAKKANVASMLQDVSALEQKRKYEEQAKAKAPAEVSFSNSKFIRAVADFLESPFKEDKRFALQFLAGVTRDRVEECEELLNKLFMKNVFTVIVAPRGSDEANRHTAFDILCNMIQSAKQRKRLCDEDCLIRVFEKLNYCVDSKEPNDVRILEKLSHLATLISFHTDMDAQITKIRLLNFVIKISD